MDQKLAILTAFYYYLSLGDSKISAEIVQDLRVLVSLFVEEIISDDEYTQFLDSLIDEKHLQKPGNTWSVCRTGEALVDALSSRVLGQTNLNRLKDILQNYISSKRDYLQNVNRQLATLHDRREQKVKEAQTYSLRAVGILVSLDYNQDYLIVNGFSLLTFIRRQEDALESEVNFAAKKITQRTGLPIVITKKDNGFEFISFTDINSIDLFGQKLERDASFRIDRHEVDNWNEAVVLQHLEQCLHPVGYIRSGRVFTNYKKTNYVKTNVGVMRENPSLKVDVSVMKNDCVFLWLDSYVSPRMRVLDFLEDNIEEVNDEKALSLLSTLKLRVLPAGFEVDLIDIQVDKDLSKELVPDNNLTFGEYWEKVRYSPLEKSLQPLLTVKSNVGELNYPAEMVYIDRFSLERHFGGSVERKIKASIPKERFSTTKDLFFSMKNVNPPYQKRFVKINFERYTPSVSNLIEFGAVETAIRIRPPMLEFESGAVSSDPLDIFSDGYNPICGRKKLTISYIIAPNNLGEADFNKFIQHINRAFKSYNFGEISRSQNLSTILYDPNADISELEDKIRELGSKQSENIALGIIPNRRSKHYFAIKRLFPMRTKTPIQLVRLETYQDIINKRFRGFQMLCLKILVKSLKEGETIWRLSNSAGLSQESSLYIGIGFSRFPREKKVSKCAAVIHDSRGSKISWKIFATPQERMITTQWFKALLRNIRDVIEQEKPSRLVFYRTGTLYPRERQIIQDVIENFPWLSSIKISFVSILDGSNHRFYTYHKGRNKYGNIPSGYALIKDEKEAFLSTSNYDDRELKHGTVVPVRLKLEFGSDKITDIVKEYHDQTYVYWLAPLTTTKTPLVITVADKFAELTREGVSVENFFYLDL